ncbi:bifunctional UDP-N-acetylglucosamine diphosphorylase/glucosamine-1-phosphate N-acetyltransferase GlmU [Desulfolithobacter sp.]
MKQILAVILAAGKGTRMKSDRAKVLHEVFYRPMLHHVLDAVTAAGIQEMAVIVGHQREEVISSLSAYQVTPVLQEEQLGTGHAVLCGEKQCHRAEQVMILCGDTPLIRPKTLRAMIDAHLQSKATVTLMTTRLDDPFGYGRIITDTDGTILEIVEQKDATPEQRRITEINAGIYLADRDFLFQALRQVGTDNSQGEVYLTDIIGIARHQGKKVHTFLHPVAIDVLGVNSRVELAQAHRELQMRRNRELMLSGVTMYGPETISIGPDIAVGRDTVIHPGVHVTGRAEIGSGCILHAGVMIHDAVLDDRAVIGAHAVLQNCRIEKSEHIPPLTLRVS